jgi:hypothetical protein
MNSSSAPKSDDVVSAASVFPGPPRHCPLCGSPAPAAVAEGGGVHFRCLRCGAAIYVEQGRVWALREVSAAEG